MNNSIQIGQTIISFDASVYNTNESLSNNLLQIDIVKIDDQSNICSVYNNGVINWSIDITLLTITGANGLSIINL